MPPPNDLGSLITGRATFYETLTAAVNDMQEHGFDSAERLEFWIRSIREAAARSMTPPHVLEKALNDTLRSIYRSKVDRGAILRDHAGVSRFTLEKVKPKLRSELDRRIMASANLIKLNRERAISDTVQRFSGWASSIPPGGSDAVDRMATKADIRKSMASLPFRERRVSIDQGHKFVANLNNILAVDNGAIALVWRSKWREAGYNYREDHKERDGHIYLIRDSWAHKAGLVKPGPDGYYDEIDAVGEKIFCRCSAHYLYALRRLPEDMITARGVAEMERTKAA